MGSTQSSMSTVSKRGCVPGPHPPIVEVAVAHSSSGVSLPTVSSVLLPAGVGVGAAAPSPCPFPGLQGHRDAHPPLTDRKRWSPAEAHPQGDVLMGSGQEAAAELLGQRVAWFLG